MARTGTTLIVGAAMVVLAACQQEQPMEHPGEPVRSELPRDLSPDVSEAAQAELVAGMNAFAFDLHRLVAAEGGNAFTSPFSISTALAMTYAGARGETETQLAEALHYTLPQEELHPAMNWLDLELESRGQGASNSDGEPFELRIANSLWGRLDREFVPEYLDLIAVSYGAGLWTLDFAGDPEGSRETINAWVEEQTEDRIQDLLPPGSISQYTALILTNAIYFNAAWETEFDPSDTSEGEFTTLAGPTVAADLMRQTTSYRYAELGGTQAVELPYDGGEMSMVVLLPAAGAFEEFEAGLDEASLAAFLDAMDYSEVSLTLPRFSFTRDVALKEALSALGMPIAFGPEADFTGMDPLDSMFIDEVFHKAFVAVDEAGTEAAAATAVVMTDGSAEPGIEMRADRPFLFLIRDLATGAILFVGRLVDPTA